MNDIENEQFPEVIKYLIQKQVLKDVISISTMKTGASGSSLFDVTDKKGRFVVKQSNEINNHGYKIEYNFYSLVKSVKYWNLDIPEVLFSKNSDELGYILVFPFYESITNSEWNNEFQIIAIDLIAKLHSLNVEEVSEQLNIQYKKVEVNAAQAKNAFDEWSNILRFYPNDFDVRQIELIHNNLGNICDILNSGMNCVCHGDFHKDNILFDNNSNKIILTDWQNISIGKGAGDISFFISRGRDSGLIINEDEIVNYYCKRIFYYTGEHVEKGEIHKKINASNVFVSFMYWAFYLKDADIGRVCGIHDKMINSFKTLQF